MSSVYESNEGKIARDEEKESRSMAETMARFGMSLMEEKDQNGEVGKGEVKKKEIDEEKDDGDNFVLLEKLKENYNLVGGDWEDWEEWPCGWSFEEYYEKQQRLWKEWAWNPYWDIELMNNNGACDEVYNNLVEDQEEVPWEDDLWQLKGIKDVPPNP